MSNNTSKLDPTGSMPPAATSSEYSARDSSESESDPPSPPPVTSLAKEVSLIQNKSSNEIMKEIEQLNSILSSSSSQHILDQKALLETEISLLHQGISFDYSSFRNPPKALEKIGKTKKRL
jgi:hypothetical protein